MAATYDLSRDFNSGDELNQQTPFWVVGIARFANQVTYFPQIGKSVNDSDDFTMQERTPIVLTSEVQQIQVGAAKDAHVSNLAFTVVPELNMLTEVMPGDWVVGCMLNSETQGRAVADKMRSGQAINGWSDGLKFLGKASSCRKSIDVSEDGTLKASYSIQAVGFGEFDTSLFYNPQLAQNNAIPVTMAQFGLVIQNIVSGNGPGDTEGVDINKVIPELVKIIFGQGAWNNGPTLETRTGSVPGSPNTSYLVPKTIFGWLGLDPSIAKTYNDLLYVLIGIQHYRTVANASENSDAWNLFQPDGITPDASGDVLKAGADLIGWFPLSAPPMQASVWDMLSTWMNEPLNEMFIALKVDPGGDIFPHLVVRQTPYTSGAAGGGNEVTSFMELPRWKLPSGNGRNLIISANIGRSDATRVNMVHVSGSGIGNSPYDANDWFVLSPPVTDLADIKRHGVRTYMPTINCLLRDNSDVSTVWRDIMADVVMGQQLRLNGQFTCLGIQSPIAPGDNLEFDGLVFHIEGVTHMAGIAIDGRRVFSTVLQVTHGIDDEAGQAANSTAGQFPREAIFPGIQPGDRVLQNQSVSTTEGE